MEKRKITQLVQDELMPFFQTEGYVLYHMEYVKEGKEWFLRLFIEKAPEAGEQWPGNVSTEDCEKVSRFISDRLDQLDPIEQNYYLEVSSPGMDRPLIKDEDYKRYVGQLVDIRLYENIDGKKVLNGRLSGITADAVSIQNEIGKEIVIPRKNISVTRLTVVF